MMTHPTADTSALHLVLSAAALRECATVAVAGDSVLFLADGVMALLNEATHCLDDGIDRLWSRNDLQARGLAELAARAGVQAAADEDLAGLLAGHRHCLSWK